MLFFISNSAFDSVLELLEKLLKMNKKTRLIVAIEVVAYKTYLSSYSVDVNRLFLEHGL